jgi:hypothetical protein
MADTGDNPMCGLAKKKGKKKETETGKKKKGNGPKARKFEIVLDAQRQTYTPWTRTEK